MNWSGISKSIALFLEVIILIWVSKQIARLILHKNLDHYITTLDNLAVAIAVSGYLLSIMLAVSGLLTGNPTTIANDLLIIGMYGLLAIILMLLSIVCWPISFRISLEKDIFLGRNISSAIVAFGGFISTGYIFKGSLTGEGGSVLHVTVFFIIGQVFLFATALIYQWITPYDIYEEVNKKSNIAASLGFAGALIAIGIIISNAVSGDFTDWDKSFKDLFLMLTPIILLWPVRLLFVNGLMLGWKNLNKEIIEDKNVGAGLFEAVSYIGLALLFVDLIK